MKKTLKVFVTMILSISIIVTIFSSPLSLSALSPLDTANTTSQSKIDPDLYETADTKDGKYLVSIFRENISDDFLNKAVLQKTGYSVEVYESETFYTQVVPQIQMRVSEAVSKSKTEVNASTKAISMDTEDKMLEAAVHQEMDEYIAAKRGVIRSLNTERNSAFVKEYISNPEDIVFCSEYTTNIVVYLTKQEIMNLAEIKDVVAILPYQNLIAKPSQNIAVPQISADDITGTQSANYNNGQGYTGTGVKIGIVEAEGGICDVTNIQLVEAYNEGRLVIVDNYYNNTLVPTTVRSHATKVTALIIGSEVTVEGQTYCGVVPDSTVYQIASNNSNTFQSALERLATLNVSVINASLGFDYSHATEEQTQKRALKYQELDRYLDEFIDQNNISVIVAAGNKENNDNNYYMGVSAPGKAYNAITVGNAGTKSSLNTPSGVPYSTYYRSLYEEADYLTNKPDIMAPGTYIRIASDHPNTIDSGTSLSAPLVAGIVAQIHQINPVCKTNPTLTKAIILAGADYDAMSDNNDPTCDTNGLMREKSGVGFANAVNSVNIALNSRYQSGSINLKNGSVLESYLRRIPVSVPDNTKIRIVLTYHKPYYMGSVTAAYANDLDLWFCDPDENIVGDAWSSTNNTEVIEYVVTEGGTHEIIIVYSSLIDAGGTVFMHYALSWSFEPVSP